MTILLLGDKDSCALQIVSDFLKPKIDVLWLNAKTIIDDLIIDDEIKANGTSSIHWHIFGRDIYDHTITGVVNALYYLEDSLFEDFHEDDKKYCQSEFDAYLLFALTQFKNVINPPYGGGISGYFSSLPYQWLMVSNIPLSIQVPKYYFGRSKSVPLEFLANPNIVYSDNIFEYRHWETNVPAKLCTEKSSTFCYERPSGDPVMLLALDDNYWCQAIYEQDNYDYQHNMNFSKIVTPIMAFFHYRYATLLLFVNKQTGLITFGAIEPSLELQAFGKEAQDAFLSTLFHKLTL